MAPGHSVALNMLAVVYWHQEDRDRALEYARRAVAADMRNAAAGINLGKMCLQVKELDACSEAIDAVLDYEPENIDALKNDQVVVTQLSEGVFATNKLTGHINAIESLTIFLIIIAWLMYINIVAVYN